MLDFQIFMIDELKKANKITLLEPYILINSVTFERFFTHYEASPMFYQILSKIHIERV